MAIRREFKLTIRNVLPVGRETYYSEVRPDIKVNGTVCKLAECSTTRNAYRYGDYIIKVCRPSRWRTIGCQTEAEIKLWRRMDDEDRKFFVPLVDWGKTKEDKIPFVVQRFIPCELEKFPPSAQIGELYSVLDKYRASGDIIFDDYGGNHACCNVLMQDKKLKVFDWGCNMYTRYSDEKPAYRFQRS